MLMTHNVPLKSMPCMQIHMYILCIGGHTIKNHHCTERVKIIAQCDYSKPKQLDNTWMK